MDENQIAEMQYWDMKKASIGTLRDQFAMATLQGFLSGGFVGDGEGKVLANQELTKKAYETADAMMKARND